MISGRGSQVTVLLLLWKEGERSQPVASSQGLADGRWQVTPPLGSAGADTQEPGSVSAPPASPPGSPAQTDPPLKEVPAIFLWGIPGRERGVSSRYFSVTHQPWTPVSTAPRHKRANLVVRWPVHFRPRASGNCHAVRGDLSGIGHLKRPAVAPGLRPPLTRSPSLASDWTEPSRCLCRTKSWHPALPSLPRVWPGPCTPKNSSGLA